MGGGCGPADVLSEQITKAFNAAKVIGEKFNSSGVQDHPARRDQAPVRSGTLHA
jgi:hypothetical protein